MKECRVCGDVKPATEFGKATKNKDGLKIACKQCCKIKAAKYYKENKERILKRNKNWSSKNKEKHKALQRSWEAKNKENRRIKQNNRRKERYRKAPHKICEYVSRRNAKKIKAMPSWLNEDHKWMIKEIYELSSLRSKATKVKHHVDHIVPLNGKNVCGLHVPWNLQVLTASENCAKGNKH